MAEVLTSVQIQQAFQPDDRGVVGVADKLLALAHDHGLHLTWEANKCHVRLLDHEDSFEVPLAKSVFRAILARVAALCNEGTEPTMTPYGGEAELALASDPPAMFRVTIANTPSVQSLVLKPIPEVVSELKNASQQHLTANVKELAS